MESTPNKPPVRGRARGRSRLPPADLPPVTPTPSEPETSVVQEEEEPDLLAEERSVQFRSMYEDDKRRRSGSSSPRDGNGNGRPSRGSPTDSVRGGLPRGGNHSPNGNGVEVAVDYVTTRPTPEFIKKGQDGRPVSLISNYYQMTTHPDFRMSLYAVRVNPMPEEERKVRQLVRAKADALGPYMLTGFQIFTTLAIKPELLNYHTVLEGDATPYEVTFELKRQVGIGESLVLQFYNAMVRQIQRGLQYELIGRHYFDHMQREVFTNWGLELWPGFQNSIRQQEAGLMLNVESVWKVVKTNSVFSIINAIRRLEGDGPNFERQCNEQIVGLSVVTTYNRKPYKIDEIAFGKSPRDTFPWNKRLPGGDQEITEISFADYYLERYRIPIQTPAQPMLVSRPTKRDIRRGQVNDILLVPEFCFPCGLSEDLRSNFRLMKDLARCLHMEPAKRVGTMNDFIQKIHQKEELRVALKRWGIMISKEPVDVTGRILAAQKILLGNNKTITPDEKADFEKGLRGSKMFSTVPLVNWAIIVSSRDAASVSNLTSTMRRVAGPMDYRMNEPTIIKINGIRTDSYLGGITEAMAKFSGRVDMMFVILSNNNLETYSQVKKKCSREYGILSQCFLQKNLNNKGLMSICTKMVIQMIAKQGGQPWAVKNPMKTAMVLGYDVHHAGAGGGMSVGAITATMDAALGSYYSTIERLPADRQEIANTVVKMFAKCLVAYGKRNGGKYPAHIMMYRDGVGEGQLRDIKETEVAGFEEKIKTMYQEKGQEIPKFTYIVVNKRINTRFFQSRNRNFDNPMPGTVVDDTVTRPERYDFFLVSQTARQGCVSPTHYNVIHDTSGLPPGKLQEYTYRLCHLYYNWSGTVAVPGPCQNAHKYALQAGTAIKGPVHMNLEYLLHYL